MDQIAQFLRPAGVGMHTVSTGRRSRQALQQAFYGTRDAGEAQARWRTARALPGLRRAGCARVLEAGDVLVVPQPLGDDMLSGEQRR